ncbi:MAG TPA: hypothetical protein VHF51_00900 [Solirubrobacteraceae bacterium]|nr:hypothetical protein [Solirubrobacteraceae bacterium]
MLLARLQDTTLQALEYIASGGYRDREALTNVRKHADARNVRVYVASRR